jgi:hypothetical protein
MDQGPRYLKPGWLTSRVLNPLAMRLAWSPPWPCGVGCVGSGVRCPSTCLNSRVSGISGRPGGDTEWVRNLRVTGRGEVRRLTCVEAFRATELPDREKPRIIEAYLARWGYQVKRSRSWGKSPAVSGGGGEMKSKVARPWLEAGRDLGPREEIADEDVCAA